MPLSDYVPRTWTNGMAINAASMNNIEGQVDSLTDYLRLGGITTGSGDALTMYNTAVSGRMLDARIGTSSSPDVAAGPVIKAHRTVAHTEAQLVSLTGSSGADGVDEMSALTGICVGTSTTQVQPVGVSGFAKNSGTSSGAAGGPSADACGLYGTGRVTGSGIGTGVGGFVLGRVDNDTGKANGLEVAAYNGGTVDHTNNTTGFSTSQGLWITASSGRHCGTGIKLGNPFGAQFKTGLHFNGQTSATHATYGATVGPTINESIRDDSSAATSLLVNGTHATAAIAVASGSGPVLVGKVVATQASPLFEVGTTLQVTSDGKIGVFGVTPVVRQTGGAATAAASYSTNEQTMMNAMYSALRNYGLLT